MGGLIELIYIICFNGGHGRSCFAVSIYAENFTLQLRPRISTARMVAMEQMVGDGCLSAWT